MSVQATWNRARSYGWGSVEEKAYGKHNRARPNVSRELPEDP